MILPIVHESVMKQLYTDIRQPVKVAGVLMVRAIVHGFAMGHGFVENGTKRKGKLITTF